MPRHVHVVDVALQLGADRLGPLVHAVVSELAGVDFLAIDEGGYGFNVLDAGGSYEEFISYLTELWTAVIEKRMAAEVQQERDRRNK